jgi:hypothetical protein
MRGVCKILVLLLMLAALPLRGYAAAVAELCEAHHGGVQTVKVSAHDQSSADAQVPHDHASEGTSAASASSACAGCCVGPSQAPSEARSVPAGPVGADRIPFFGRRLPVHVPDRLDRPPLLS